MDNLAIYNACRAVPKEAQKPFNNGKFSGTDINPMWRIKKLTEQFGPAGIGWYVDDVTERCEEHGEMTIAVVTLKLYIKVDGEWSKPIYGTGGNVVVRKGSVSDEGYKMAYTDALSVACKALGIGADVWFAKDETKYTAKPAAPEKKEEKPAEHRAEEGRIATGPEAPRNDRERPAAKEPEKFVCAECGCILKPYVGINGKEVGVRRHAAASEDKYGRVLCLSCIQKLNEDAG